MSLKLLPPVAVVTALAALALSAPAQAKTNCGSFHTKAGAKVTVYRIHGRASCRTGRSIARAAIGSRCEGEKVKKGWRCNHGAPALGEPAASGFTLHKGKSSFQARVR